jgi:hypothetical protein
VLLGTTRGMRRFDEIHDGAPSVMGGGGCLHS